jgi:hypothetical protein
MLAWIAVTAAIWLVAFVGLGLVARSVERALAEPLAIPAFWIGAIVATLVAGSVGIFGGVVIAALNDEDRRRRLRDEEERADDAPPA